MVVPVTSAVNYKGRIMSLLGEENLILDTVLFLVRAGEHSK